MAKIKKIKSDGHTICNMTQYTIRIPNEWVPFIDSFMESKAREEGIYRLADMMRELVYKAIVAPIKEEVAKSNKA